MVSLNETALDRAADADPELADRLKWLLRLRWLVVPGFVAVELASGLLTGRSAPWTALLVGAGLLALNTAYAAALARRPRAAILVALARFESALLVSIPILVVLLNGDPASPLRYGVLVGVVGAAAVLPRTGDVAVVAAWAVVSLVASDAIAVGFDPARVTHALVARWAIESGVVATVAILVGFLHGQRVRAHERLRLVAALAERSRQEWESTLDHLNEMVVLTDDGGVVTRANRAFAKLLGARPHELVGRPLSALLAGHPERWWTDQVGAIVEVEDPVFDTLYEVTVTRVADRVIRVARDVGEQRRLYARLVQADKLASVGLLASGVAHEINNPTAFVTSNLTELRRYCDVYERAFADLAEVALASGGAERASAVLQARDVVFARREAPSALQESLAGMERIRQMVSNLRSVARRDQAGEPVQPVSLAEVIEVVTRTAGAELRATDARIDARQPVWVMGHRGELVDVVLNLVVNAVQAKDGERPNRVTIELAREGATAVLRVSDTGKGIPAGHLKRLYEPFFTTKAAGEGTGLGLALARNIVLAHGGSIDVQTAVGVGTTFTLRLPATELDAEPGARRAPLPARG
jgi:two-component system NtrC family sensor kinase